MVHVVWGHPRCECFNLISVSFWLLVVAASNLSINRQAYGWVGWRWECWEADTLVVDS